MKSLLTAADAAGCAMAHAEDLLGEGIDTSVTDAAETEETATIDQRHREAQPVRSGLDGSSDVGNGADWLRSTVSTLLGGRATA